MIKKFYSKGKPSHGGNRQEHENVIKILEILHDEALPVLKSGSELANFAEAASLFNFNDKAFW
jgi:hypothetical protein